jgi:hypothetical protein
MGHSKNLANRICAQQKKPKTHNLRAHSLPRFISFKIEQ